MNDREMMEYYESRATELLKSASMRRSRGSQKLTQRAAVFAELAANRSRLVPFVAPTVEVMPPPPSALPPAPTGSVLTEDYLPDDLEAERLQKRLEAPGEGASHPVELS